jgi:hypothetical protein
MSITPCGGPLTLGPGDHVIETALGRDDGINVDRLLLSSPAAGAAPAASASAAPPIDVLHQSATAVTARVTTTPGQGPFWLVFGQSQNSGWRATVRGRSLGKPVVVNGYANGWLVTPPAAGGSVTVDLTFTPQRVVDLALLVSALGIGLCILLALVRPRRRWAVAGEPSDVDLPTEPSLASPMDPVGWRPRPATAVATVVVAGVIAGTVIAPAVGVGVALAVALVVWRPQWRPILSVGSVVLLAGSVLYVLQLQVRYRFPTKIEWPEHFDKVALVPWAALALLVIDAVFELRSRRRDRGP